MGVSTVRSGGKILINTCVQVLAREQSHARGLGASAGGLRSGRRRTATSAMRSDTGNSERIGRARTKYTIMRRGHKNGKYACEIK
eukprot:336003-Pleurochrysis_carterae.AAC.1